MWPLEIQNTLTVATASILWHSGGCRVLVAGISAEKCQADRQSVSATCQQKNYFFFPPFVCFFMANQEIFHFLLRSPRAVVADMENRSAAAAMCDCQCICGVLWMQLLCAICCWLKFLLVGVFFVLFLDLWVQPPLAFYVIFLFATIW